MYRTKADRLASGDRQLVIANLIAIAADIKDSILFLVTGELRLAAEFIRVFVVLGRCLGKSFELFGNNLALSLRRSGRWHGSIVADIMKLKGVIKLLSTINRLLFKVTVAQQVDCTVTKFARQ